MADDQLTDVFVVTQQPEKIVAHICRTLALAMEKALGAVEKSSNSDKNVSELYFVPLDSGKDRWDLFLGHGTHRTRRASIEKMPLM